ncbi:hypothetical protein [Phormidium sp. FACHB-1136]|uniref:hypothetical protein n=1 Tax=Phormidium sp. FACHB-1136 TaxID=2692848 RepID=UPI0016841391|nr:hypothetical protein [Phormidium sp. FACHB-1136]MBD2428906.1 hypothetical protein [Phormidium sp. FACHB-1136]
MKAKLITCTVYFHSAHLGQPLGSICLPDSCHFLGLVRAEQLIHFQQNPVVEDGDCLIAIALNPAISPHLGNCLQLRQKVH